MTWVTPQGEVPDVNPLGDLSNWFSLIKDGSGGRITSVYYPSGESRAVVAFKKSLSQHITVGGEVVREVREGGVHVVRGRSFDEEQRRRISVEKVSTYLVEVSIFAFNGVPMCGHFAS